MAEHNALGKWGEQLAVDFLLKKGFEILERNWRFQRAEIDIIALKENRLIIVEVKTRSTTAVGVPQDFVSAKKRQLLQQAAVAFVDRYPEDVEVQFDIIAIQKIGKCTEIEHLENAFFYF